MIKDRIDAASSPPGGGRSLDRMLRTLIASVAPATDGDEGSVPVAEVDLEGRRFLLYVQPVTVARPVALSPRELEIVRLVARGNTNKGISLALGISVWTVGTHLRRIYGKLGVHSRAAMVAHISSSPPM